MTNNGKNLRVKCVHCGDAIFADTENKIIFCQCKSISVNSGKDFIKINGKQGNYVVDYEFKIELPNLELCESKNHKDHRGDLWKCARCKKTLCYAEGSDGEYYELCDDCYMQAVVKKEKSK